MIGKALEFQVDQIFLDLEDAVAPEAKELARQLISSAGQKKFKAPIVSLRINSIESAWFSDDIALLKSGVGRWVDSIILPKVRHEADVHRVSELLQEIERTSNRDGGAITIDAQIESAEGLVNCEEIARAPRVTSLNFGPADFMADLGMTSAEVTSNEYALMKILVAARAAGIAAIDGPTLEVRDIAKFESSASIAAAMEIRWKVGLAPRSDRFVSQDFYPNSSSI